MIDPLEIKKRYLTTQQSPPHFDQYRYIYEQILTETGACEFKHHLHDPNKTTSLISFSKIFICTIMPITTWGIHPHTLRDLDLRNKQTKYTYWDYVDAFTQVFYYQNPIKNHSWFIRVCPDVFKNDVPNWFFVWWDKFGLSMDILPEPIRLAFNEWNCAYSRAYSYLNKNRDLSISKSLVHFTIRFNIPWIWKWEFACDYQNKIPRLKRIFFVKWWDNGMNHIITETVDKIKQHTQACFDSVKQPALPVPPALLNNPFVKIQKELKQQYPGLSEHEIILKSMNYLKEQFFQTIPDDDSMRSGSSQPSTEPDVDPAEHVLAGESQLPEDEEPTLGDFWDSMTAIFAEKLAKDKSRKGKDPAL